VLAAWAGGWISAVVPPHVLKYTLAFTFIGFAALLFLVFGIGILIGY